MSNGATVQTGPPLVPEEEVAYKQRIAEEAADQAEAEVKVIEEKLAGWKQALADKKAEAKQLRANAKEVQS